MAASVQSMTEFWKTFDLPELQKSLDSTATELANRQDESDISRKRLIEQSREFKKNTPEDIRKVVSPLLKSFQGEIDALSKRSKAAEASFLSVYKKLIDLPDPVSVLEYALQVQKKAQRVQDLEIENKQLRETLAEYNHEFAEVKNQEVTIKQLRERLKEGEEKVEAVAEARAKEKERELQRQFVEKERQLQDTQLEVAKKLGEAEQRVASLNYQLENAQSELFEVKAKYDEATSAKSDEMEMVMADMERANERATAAEREVEKLKHQLNNLTASLSDRGQMQKGPDMEQAIDILQRSSLEVELAAKEKEISQLVEDVQRLQASLKKLQETTSIHISKLEEELSSKNKAFKILEEKLQSQEDYEEIRRELSVLKSIEFSSRSPSDEVDGGPDKTKSLEMLLLEKNKSLQSENTQLKVSSSELSESSSPTLSSNAEAFVSLLGEEIAASYRSQQSLSGKSSPESTSKNGISQAENISSVSSPVHDVQEEKKSPSSETGGDIPPQTFSSPRSDASHVRTPTSSEILHHPPHLPPPQSPQIFHPGFPGPLMPNYMGLNIPLKQEVNGMQGLDTGMVSKTVRELLSIHNIGQRLFAKHVLGLSQGTVSELLSKPKSWDKLTEKGRESYRKMHSWATDERNILALKAISPKKGSQPLLPSIQQEDSQTEKRIFNLLHEAQQAMQHKKVQEQVWNPEHQNAMVSNIYQEMARYRQMQGRMMSATSPTLSQPQMPNHAFHDASRRRNERERPADTDIEKDMVERIYRQELIKLAQAAENAGNIAASTLYQQMLARLAQNVRVKDDREPGELRRSSHTSPNGLGVKAEPPDSTSDDLLSQSNGPIDLSTNKQTKSEPTTPSSAGSDKSLNNSAHHAGSAFFLVRPKVNGHDVGGPDNHVSQQQQTRQQQHPQTPTQTTPDGISPLQRMQHIANSLMTHPHIGPPCNKPLKAVLPPITQEEFDQYTNMNTEELVKQVKETLSQYSISQRLFGESILGLSQGSVSDLLARPKPWHMLTQKGREPFIRMQLFLEDAEAIPKLVASQYQISPDKLMRSNSIGKEQKMEGMGMGAWPGPMPGGFPAAALPLVSPVQGSLKVSQHPEKIPRPPNVPLMLPSLPPVSPMEPHPFLSHHHLQQQQQQQSHWASFSYPSSMLEVVAMTSEIDTLELTSRVKDVLQFNNLGQKLFGEAVLGLSQGSVSELLSKPKPWHMLSIKGREPFIKMHLWLSDTHNVERLKHFQNEIKANRRRRHSIEERYDSSGSMPKRPRVFFSEEQKERLRQAYNRDPYPNQGTIEALASSLGVGVKTVINWFHNHRMRAKQQQHANSPTTPYNEFSESVDSKGDPLDENSNHSDISSLSGDNSEAPTMVPNFPAAFPRTDSNQWMFPQFERMYANRKRSQDGSEDRNVNDVTSDIEDDAVENASSQHSAKDNPEETKDSDTDIDDENDKNDNDHDDSDTIADDTSNLDSSTEKIEKDIDNLEEKKQSQHHAGANKRKRSHPKYVSAGRHLDKTVNAFDGVSFGNSINNNDEDTEKENESINNNKDNSNITNDIVEHLEKIAKVKKSLEKNSEDFSFDSAERNFSIDKITKSIAQNSTEDWEF